MKKIIYKYPLPEGGNIGLLLPELFTPLYVGEQNGKLYLWAIVDPDSQELRRTFYIRGTGLFFVEEFTGDYIGTAQMSNGLVWHVFSEYKF